MADMANICPYDCFGSDEVGFSTQPPSDSNGSSENHAETLNEKQASSCSARSRSEIGNETPRDKSCGVLAFHPCTEQSLLIHVKNNLVSQSQEATTQSIEHAPSNAVLQLIDDFCLSRHWMMHMGPQKGAIVLGALEKSIMLYRQQQCPQHPFVAVELGTYCGYSAIMIAERLRQEFTPLGSPMLDSSSFHVYTYEVNEIFARIAEEFLALSGLKSFVSVVLLHRSNAALSFHQSSRSHVNFLFVDHDKDTYLDDVQSFENLNLLRPKSVVCADNVIFANISNYTKYMKEKQQKGYVQTETLSSLVEYCTDDDVAEFGLDMLQDGVGQ